METADNQQLNSSGGQRSGRSKSKKNHAVAEARTPARTRAEKLDFYVNVDAATLREMIEQNRVKVERSGSRRKNKDGSIRDYRGKYVAIRERAGARQVLAFGSVEKMAEYLSNRLQVYFCQNCQNVSINPCQQCQREEATENRAYLM